MAQTRDAKGRWMQSVLAADTLTGDKVVNRQKEDLGTIEHLMIDVEKGRIAYAVLSFGGFLGMGDKLFAIPWSALAVDTVKNSSSWTSIRSCSSALPVSTRITGRTWPTAPGVPKSPPTTAPSPIGLSVRLRMRDDFRQRPALPTSQTKKRRKQMKPSTKDQIKASFTR